MPPSNPKSPSEMTNAEIKAFLIALVVIFGVMSSLIIYSLIQNRRAIDAWIVGGGLLLGILTFAACASRDMIRELLRRRKLH
jgi:hypothetical protein